MTNAIRDIPETWKAVTLGSFVESEKGKKPRNQASEQSSSFPLPYIDIQAFEKGVIDSWTDYSGPLSQDTNFPNLRYSLLCVAYCFNPAYSVAARGGPVVKRWTTSLFVHRLTTGPQVSRRPAGRGHKYTGCPSSHQFQRWDTVVHFCWRHPMETLVRPLVVVEVEIALQ